MKKILILPVLSLLAGCAGINVKDPEAMQGKSGIIGVVRTPSGICDSSPENQVLQIGTEKIELSDNSLAERLSKGVGNQGSSDDKFIAAYLPSGAQEIIQFSGQCVLMNKRMGNYKLSPSGKAAIVIPENGFCKTTISMKGGGFSIEANDGLLKKFWEKEKVGLSYESIPFCEVK